MNRKCNSPLFVLPIILGMAGTAAASTLTVTNASDKGPGSLRGTITNAKSGDTIIFAPSLNGQTITLTSDQLTINNSIDIEGPSASLLAISGSDTNRIFNINEGLNVTIAGLTLTHGRAVGGNSNPAGGGGGGGAILNAGSTLTLANDVFSENVSLGNSAGPKGGAIANFGSGFLTVTDSAFVNNRADGRVKKGMFAEGGAIFSTRDGPSARITRCTFTGNQAIGGDGGVLTSGFVVIGSSGGGALHVEGASTFTVTDSTFTNNRVIAGSGSAAKGNNVAVVGSVDGGAIANHDGGTLAVSGCTFAYNQAIGGSNTTGTIITFGYFGSALGGAIDCDGTTTVANSMFLGNEALGGGGNNAAGGGTIFAGGGYGGAIACNPLGSSGFALNVNTCAFANNQAIGGAGSTGGLFPGDGIGGGIAVFPGFTATVTASTFTGNQAVGGQSGAGANGSDGLGGGLANVLGSALSVSGCTLTGNQAVGGAGFNGGNGLGGGIFNDGLSIFPGNLGAPATLTVLVSTITGNLAVGGAPGAGGIAGQGIGGGFYLTSGGVVCFDLFTSASISGNAASTSYNDVFGVFTTCP